MSVLACGVCGESIVSGERRCPQDRPTESVTVHERCEPTGHVPRQTNVPERSFALVFGEGVANVFCMIFGEWEQLDQSIDRVSETDIVGGRFAIESASTVLYCDDLRPTGGSK